jgi:hypothetical protein
MGNREVLTNEGHFMKRTLMGKFSLSVTLIVLAGTASVANANSGSLKTATFAKSMSSAVELFVHATGAEILPADNANMGGSPTGFADATFRVDTNSNRVCYTVTTTELPGVVAGHIHIGAKGVDGGVAVALDPAKFNHGRTCISVKAAVATDIAMNPSMYYFNLHSKTYSGGVVRGQLRVKSPSVELSVHATGAEILPADNANMGGSPTGFADATFKVDTKSNRICYTVTTSSLTGVVAGHIHIGAKGVDGGVAVALDPAKFNHGRTCISVSAAVATDIAMNPSMYYFNLHSKQYSGGAVRGQLGVKK